MSYQVFARKYRPTTFDDVLGQDHVIQTLKNAITQKRLAHAYLFVGPRGTGKTSTARILAKALNCTGGPSVDFDPEEDICQEIAEGRSLDVLEIDGASNNGVEQVRALRENVQFAPARGQFKIYYIDEVHMLTTQAFNALLKTLEEPPAHVKFIFATTEAHKILPTIISRCQRFDLRPIDTETIAKHLIHIAEEEKVSLDEAAAWAIAKGADGGMRDAQSMMDQLVAFCGEKITEENVLDIFGFTSRETVAGLSQHLLSGNTAGALGIIHQQADSGKDLSQLLAELITCVRALLVAQVDPNAGNEGIPEALWSPLLAAATAMPTDRLLALMDILAEADGRMKWSSNKRLHFELAAIKAVQTLGEVRLSDVIKTLSASELPDGPITVPVAHNSQPEPTTTPIVTQEEEPAPAPIAEAPPVEAEAPTLAPEVQETPAEPEPEIVTPEPVAIETAPEPEPVQEEAPKINRSAPLADRFDSLLAAAPDADPEPEPAAPEPAKEEKVPAEKAENAAAAAEKAFYNDPLIKAALETFEGTLQS